MSTHKLLIGGLAVSIATLAQPVFSQDKASTSEPMAENAKVDTSGGKQTDPKSNENEKKKAAKNVVRIAPLKSVKELAK
jgi:hypothetical protein